MALFACGCLTYCCISLARVAKLIKVLLHVWQKPVSVEAHGVNSIVSLHKRQAFTADIASLCNQAIKSVIESGFATGTIDMQLEIAPMQALGAPH